MNLPYFLEWSENERECLEIYTANTLQLMPFSNERYVFFMPDVKERVTGFGGWLVTPDGEIPLDDDITDVVDNTNYGYLITNNIAYNSWDKVYFKIYVNFLNESKTFYSSKFRVSSLDIDKTTYIQFNDRKVRSLTCGVRLNLYYWHQVAKNEVTTYYQVTRERTISVGSKRDRVERYYLDNVGIGQANALLDVLTWEKVYFDGTRTFCYEMPELDMLQADETFVFADVLVTKDYNDTISQPTGMNIYVVGQRQENVMVGDGEDNIINTNITTDGN